MKSLMVLLGSGQSAGVVWKSAAAYNPGYRYFWKELLPIPLNAYLRFHSGVDEDPAAEAGEAEN